MAVGSQEISVLISSKVMSEYGVHASEIRPEGLCGPEMGIPDSDIGTGSCTVVEEDPNGRYINRGPYGLGQIIKQRSNQAVFSILFYLPFSIDISNR